MKITKEWLREQNACSNGVNWFLTYKFTSPISITKALIKDARFQWAAWLLTHLFSLKQNVLFSCFSAKTSLKYFEQKYPNDKRPRLAIETAMKWAKCPTEENRSAARSAWLAAESAARSAAVWKKILSYGIKLYKKGELNAK